MQRDDPFVEVKIKFFIICTLNLNILLLNSAFDVINGNDQTMLPAIDDKSSHNLRGGF